MNINIKFFISCITAIKDYFDFIRKTTTRPEVIESWPIYEVKVYKLETFDSYKKAAEWKKEIISFIDNGF